tara:strand:- start:3015 stop:3362 length:348 start_codon:yes stop_codon:yes gene_type:complete
MSEVAEAVQLGRYHGEVLVTDNTLSYGFSHESNGRHVGQEIYDRFKSAQSEPEYDTDVRVNSFDADDGTATSVQATVKGVHVGLQYGGRITQLEVTDENAGDRQRANELLQEMLA